MLIYPPDEQIPTTPTPTPTNTVTPSKGNLDPVWYIGNIGTDRLAYADSGNTNVNLSTNTQGGWIIPNTYRYLNGVVAGQTLPTDIAFKTNAVNAEGSTARYIAISSSNILNDTGDANRSAILGVWNNFPWISVNADHALLGATNNLKTIINRIRTPSDHFLRVYPLTVFTVNSGLNNVARGILSFNISGPGTTTLPNNGMNCRLFLLNNLNTGGNGSQGNITITVNNLRFASVTFSSNWWAQPLGISINAEIAPTWIFPQFANVNITYP